MSRQIILVTWEEDARAYQEYSGLKTANIDNINQAFVIERREDGRIALNEGRKDEAGVATFGGGMLGTLVGILGGPLGMLLGFSAGVLFGALYEAREIGKDGSIIGQISQRLSIGKTALIIDIDEQDEVLIDAYFAAKDGMVQRWGYDMVEAEIEATVQTWEQINQEAERVIKDKRKQEHAAQRKHQWEEFKNKVAQKFS